MQAPLGTSGSQAPRERVLGLAGCSRSFPRASARAAGGLLALLLAAAGASAQQALVAWGGNSSGQCDVPEPPEGVHYVEVAAGGRHTVARRSDGKVVAWGDNTHGQCDVLALPPGLKYVEVAAGVYHTVARRSDGSVVAWGDNTQGQCNVPAPPEGVKYKEIAAGYWHTVALRSDGGLAAWGDNAFDQSKVPPLPPGLSYVEVAAGYSQTLARTAGTCPTPQKYCTPGTSASGCQATLSASGTPSASDSSGFTVSASNVEGGKNGLFFYGSTGQQANPWGSGTSFQCVVPPTIRAGMLEGSGEPGACDGTFAQDLNALWTVKPAKNPGSGAEVYLQLWYRDPRNTSDQNTGFSDALSFSICP